MELKDWLELLIGVIWGAMMLVLWRRNKSKPKIWPRIFGIGGATYMLVLGEVESIFRRPTSDVSYDLINNIPWSLAIGVVCYFSGHKLARRFPNV